MAAPLYKLENDLLFDVDATAEKLEYAKARGTTPPKLVCLHAVSLLRLRLFRIWKTKHFKDLYF